MAVVHHALRWQMSEPGCAAAASVAERARAGDAATLSGMGGRFGEAAGRSPILAAFELDDSAYVAAWLSPEAVHPALVTLLAWTPEMVLLDDPDAAFLAGLHRRGGSPARPRTAAGIHFGTLARRLDSIFGRSAFGARPTAGQLGMWARPGPLERRLRRLGDRAAADRIAAMAGPDPSRAWLVTTTIW